MGEELVLREGRQERGPRSRATLGNDHVINSRLVLAPYYSVSRSHDALVLLHSE